MMRNRERTCQSYFARILLIATCLLVFLDVPIQWLRYALQTNFRRMVCWKHDCGKAMFSSGLCQQMHADELCFLESLRD